MAGVLHELSQQRLIGEAGGVVGATFYFYLTGTTDLANIYSDPALTEPLANPVEVAAGEILPDIYLDPSIDYRRRIEYTDGTVTDTDPLPLLLSSSDLNNTTGAGTIGFINSGTGAVATNLLTRGRKIVYVSDYGTIAQAIATGAGEVIVDVDVTVTSDITLASNQILRFTKGSLIVSASATITDAVLKNTGGSKIALINPKIDASATASGVPGIKLFNVVGASIWNGKLTKTNLLLESSDNTVVSGTVVSGLEIDMASYNSTAVYCSGISTVFLAYMKMYNGREGVGLYNAARNITHSKIASYGFTGDAFVIINAQQVSYDTCFGFNTGQSGFTTQRQTSGANARIVSYVNCYSWGHAFDGFDIRGATTTPWGVDTAFLLSNCHSWDNTFVGFYIVNAEGTSLSNCEARQNGLQGFNIDHSDFTILTNCRSISNAADAPSGVGKAGIYVANSLGVEVNGCKSSNTEGATQQYGVTFAGVCTNGRVVGGEFLNNTTSSHSFVAGVSMVGAIFNKEAASAVTLLEITPNGAKRGECFGIPETSFSLTWPIGSYLARVDGGGAESFLTDGAGGWYKLDWTAV